MFIPYGTIAPSLVVVTELLELCILLLIILYRALTCVFCSGLSDFHSSADYLCASGLKLLLLRFLFFWEFESPLFSRFGELEVFVI